MSDGKIRPAELKLGYHHIESQCHRCGFVTRSPYFPDLDEHFDKEVMRREISQLRKHRDHLHNELMLHGKRTDVIMSIINDMGVFIDPKDIEKRM